MNPYTVFKFNFTFDVWVTVAGDVEGTTTEKLYRTGSTGLLAPSTAMTYLYTTEQIPWHSVIRRMKDPSGTPVFEEFGEDVNRFVTSAEPIFDYKGNVNGYKHTLKRSIPVIGKN